MAYELIRVSELPETTTPDEANVLPIQAGDTLKKITFDNLKEAATGDLADDLAAEVTAREGAVSGEATARGNADTAILADLASPYSASATYAVGDYCTKDGVLKRCNTAITTAEAWNSAHWDDAILGGDVSTLRSALTSMSEDYTEVKNTVVSVDYIISDVTESSMAGGKYCVYNPTYSRIVTSNYSSGKLGVYPVVEGKRYRAHGYGQDTTAYPFALIGDTDIVASGDSYANLLQIIEVGSAERTYGTVEFTAEHSGYLYLNWQYKTGDILSLQLMEDNGYIPKTDNTLTSPILPANAKVVGGIVSGITHGLYKSGSNYYFFHADGDTNIVRLFIRRGPNNLFQWNQIAFGEIENDVLNITSSYGGFGTDIVGPISIWNGTLWPGQYGAWSGGNHGKTISGTEYATAEQISFKCLVNGKEVTDDGLYYGDVRFDIVNNLYFPQSITGADLTSATLAIVEHRYYHLTGSEMHVRVWLEFKEAARVARYYGMQAVDTSFDNVLCANNNFYSALSSITQVTDLSAKEHKIMLSRNDNGLCLDMELDNIGLGTYQKNDGSNGYVTFPNHSGGTRKTYYDLIWNASDASIADGANLMWEGTYDLYFG